MFDVARRSCLFDQDIHWWMVVDVKVVDEIALPLVVNIPFSEMVSYALSDYCSRPLAAWHSTYA
jgi:hypothetical protein